MSGWDLEYIAGPELEFRAIGHLDAQASRERDPQVMVLTGVGAGDRSYVDGPAPSGLVDHAADDRVIELDHVDPTVRDGPHVGRFTESPSLETHQALPPRHARRAMIV
jgi:hypothetical protein